MISREEFLRKEYIARINRAVDYAYANFQRDFELDEMADAACFSRFHFHRVFLAHCGETPGEFVKRLRLEKAAALLRQAPSSSITDIALASGFSGSSVFARVFKEGFGVSASEYRRKSHLDPSFAPLPGQSKEGQALGKGGQAIGKDGKERREPPEYIEGENDPRRNVMKELKYTIEVKDLPELHVAYARHVGKYSEIGEAFGRISRWAGPRGYFNESAKVLGIYHDNPDVTPEAKLRSSACVTVPAGTKVDGDIGLMDVPGGKFAVGHFEISKDEFGQAWDALMQWLPSSGWQCDDRMCYELYLNDEEKHPEKKFIVDICEPVKPL